LSPRRPSTRGACRNLIRWLLVAIVPAAIVGCSMEARRIPSPPQLELEQPPVTGWTADKLVGILSHRDRYFQSLRALASVSYRGPEGNQGFQEAILVQRPDKVRLETLSMLGAILIITVNGDEIVGFHPRERLYLRGKSTKENLYRYTGIPFELEEMTRLLAGLPPVRNSAGWQIAGNSLYREVDGGGKEIVVFDLAREIPVRWYRLAPGGNPELSAAFDEFSATPAGLFPTNITLEAQAAAQKRSLELVYQDPEVNVQIPPSVFNQEKPANAKEVPIEALVR
jgi:Domain of unknown function (DUF4292)